MSSSITARLGGVIDRLNPRERVLLGAMVLVGLGMACFLVILMTNRSIAHLKERVEQQDQLLSQLPDVAPVLRQKLEQSQHRTKTSTEDVPPLGTRLQDHATKAGMGETDLEMTPQPEERVGSWIRKSVLVRLRRKPLGQLANFWALTVNDRARYPVAITKLTIRRRRHEEDSYDVEMIVSSYSPATEPEPTKNGQHGRSNGTKNRSKSRP